MNAPSESYLKIYSLGYAAENLPIGSNILEVVPVEKLTFVDGELKSNPTADAVTGTDAVGATHQTQATTNNAIPATWFPFHSNRQTPPNIRRGERVLIWRFANMDTFLWSELGVDHGLRKLETVTYAFNGTRDESDNTTSAANCYYVEVSTHKGTITLHTSKANGEKTSHTVQFNPMAGTFTFADDLGQAVFIDSVNHLIHLANADGSQFTMDHQNIAVVCQDTFALNAAKAINITTQTLTVSTQVVNCTVQDGFTLSAANVTATASGTVDVQAPTIKLGAVTIANGKITCAGVMSSGDVIAPNIS